MTSWSFDGTDLSTFGVITLLDDYLDVANKRGGNQTIPKKHGTIFVEKFYDETEIAIGIAMKYANAADLEAGFDSLKILCAGRGQKVLSNTRADGSVRTVLASLEGKLQVSRESYNFARVVLTFKLSDPFFRGQTLVEASVLVDASPVELIVTNPGTAEECNPEIVLTGPLSHTVITNNTTGVILSYVSNIDAPRVVTVSQVDGELVAFDDLGNNVIQHLSHQGSESFMVFNPGDNTLEIADDVATSGTVAFSFYPPYL